MGEINQYMCDYLSLVRYNSDFWNGTIYGGKRRVKVWQLEQYDKGLSGWCDKKRQGKYGRRVRMLCKGKRDIILTVNLLENPKEGIPAGVLRKKDRQIPLRTVVLYCGEGTYDCEQRIKALFEGRGMRQDYRKLMLEHRIGIYNLRELQEENYETSLREIIGVFKRRDSEAELVTYYTKNKERFRYLDDVTINLMGALLGLRDLRKYAQHKGGVDMCKAFAQAVENGRIRGLEEGRRQGRKEGGFCALCCLVEKGKLKLKDAAEEAGMTEEMFLESMKIAMNI